MTDRTNQEVEEMETAQDLKRDESNPNPDIPEQAPRDTALIAIRIEEASQAHTNLNMFAAVAEMLEGGCIYGVGTAPDTAQKIVKLCRKEQQNQLRIYDMARGGKR